VDTWWHLEACVGAKRSQEGTGSVGSIKKNLNGFTPRGYLGCVLHVKGLVEKLSLAGHPHLCGVERRLGLERDEWLLFLSFLSS
jgi:hypothetical protein